MRVFLNVSVVLVCGALAGLSALAHSVPTQAAVLPTALPPVAGTGATVHDLQPMLIPVRHSSSVEAHFAAANTTHDGHLTKPQAEQSGWPRVAKHFDEIDSDHRGWITAEQIHVFNKSHHKRGKSTTT